MLQTLDLEFAKLDRFESSALLKDWCGVYGIGFFKERGRWPSFTNETEVNIAIELLERTPGWRLHPESSELLEYIENCKHAFWIAEIGIDEAYTLASGGIGVSKFILQAPTVLQPLLRTDGFVVSSFTFEWALVAIYPKFVLKYFAAQEI